MKHEIGECERCGKEDQMLILSFEGMVCYLCSEAIDFEDQEINMN